jgi:aminopeptidase N
MKTTLCCLFLLAAMPMLRGQSVFPVRDSGEARDRTYDVLHYRIEVSFDESQQKVMGKTTVTLVPLPDALDTVELDAEQMTIRKVSMRNGDSLHFVMKPKSVAICLPHPASFRDTVMLTIEHWCVPKRGLYFVQPDSSYPKTPWQIWTQGEDMDNHFWFPCYDFPNDFATVEVLATVRDRYVALSNGRLMHVRENKKEGTKTFYWKSSRPMVSYLVMLAIGEYAVLKDSLGKLPVLYYAYPDQVEDARYCFRETPDMIRVFSGKIGFPYAWEKYAQVLLHDFIEGGMENASATSLMDNYTVYGIRRRLDESPTSLIAHELAHQWWGDVVTCKDWRHLWLNEGFASYMDPIYFEERYGQDEFDLAMYNNQRSAIGTDKNQGRKPIVSVGSYGGNVYSRGSEVLHMLRSQIGDRLFWKSIHNYITDHQFTPVETNDFKRSVEEATGLNLYWFFDQWVYRTGYPVYIVSYKWNEGALQLSVAQGQRRDSLTTTFAAAVDIRVITPSANKVTRLQLFGPDTTVTIAADAKPQCVIFDDGNILLKELRFDKPQADWEFQAEHAPHAVDRMSAVIQLAEDTTANRPLALFGKIAGGDPFHAVRLEAVKAIAGTRAGAADPQVEQFLVVATRDAKSAVRAAAITGLKRFKSEATLAALRKGLQDSSYFVMTASLRALAVADSAHLLTWLPPFLSVPSSHDMVAGAALGLLVRADTVSGLEAARQRMFSGYEDGTRMVAMGIVGRAFDRVPGAEQMFLGLLHDRKRIVKLHAISILGQHGDAAALPALESLGAAGTDDIALSAQKNVERIKKRLEHTDAGK